MGIIRLHQLEFEVSHGCYKEEHKMKQKFMLNIDINTDFELAAKQDDISGTINYEKVYKICDKNMQVPVKLLEHLAYKIVQALKSKFKTIDSIRLEIQKREVQLGGKLDYISVILEM